MEQGNELRKPALSQPSGFQDQDWAEKIETAIQARQAMSKLYRRRPVGIVERRDLRTRQE